MLRGRRPRAGPAPLLTVLALALAACGGTAATAFPSASIGPPSVDPSAVRSEPPLATAGQPASADPGATGSQPGQSGSAAVQLDESLLDVLPASVSGISITSEPDAIATAIEDPSFARNVEAAAFGLAADGDDLATGIVARLRPGVFSEPFFAAWRDSYDRGACAQAGGVGTSAASRVGDRAVHVTTCVNGLLVYHAWVPERGAVVSVLSLGPRQFGAQIIAGLRV